MKQFGKIGSKRILKVPERKCDNFVVDAGFNREPVTLLQEGNNMIPKLYGLQPFLFSDLPYTALRLPFYFENFLGVFKPHKVRPGVFAVGKSVGVGMGM